MKKVIKKRSLEERKLFFARNLYKVKLEPLPKKIEKEGTKKVKKNDTKGKSTATIHKNK